MNCSYQYEPKSVVTQEYGGKTRFDININIVKKDDDSYAADLYSFWVNSGELSIEDVEKNPEQYIDYVTICEREKAKQKAQNIVDSIRENPIIPVPSLRDDAKINHRTADDVKLLGGYMLGGLDYFELASGEIVSLTQNDIANIMKDAAEWEVSLQKAKQEAWSKIDNAVSHTDIEDALKLFDTFKN